MDVLLSREPVFTGMCLATRCLAMCMRDVTLLLPFYLHLDHTSQRTSCTWVCCIIILIASIISSTQDGPKPDRKTEGEITSLNIAGSADAYVSIRLGSPAQGHGSRLQQMRRQPFHLKEQNETASASRATGGTIWQVSQRSSTV
jgi:hypothetical protein